MGKQQSYLVKTGGNPIPLYLTTVPKTAFGRKRPPPFKAFALWRSLARASRSCYISIFSVVVWLTTMWPVPLLFERRPPCFGVSLAASYMALVTTGAHKKSIKMRPEITIRLKGVTGLMSPYLGKYDRGVEAQQAQGRAVEKEDGF